MKEARYSRFRLIPWWRQEKLLKAKIMVVGAGAIGNEALKNLALLGIGYIAIVDFDKIENVNLSRSVLFRAEDVGKPKAEVAAKRIRELNPDGQVYVFNNNIISDIGLAVFRDMDVVIGALDNREARLAVNRACWKVNTPFIDGAIDVLDGAVRTFVPPNPPCYECTLTELDYEIMNERRSCQLMQPDYEFAAVPTTPTIASIVGGIQVQEAVKIIHGWEYLPPTPGVGFHFQGTNLEGYQNKYTIKKDCPSHVTFENFETLDVSINEITIKELYKIARKKLGRKTILDFEREIVYRLKCKTCQQTKYPFVPLPKLTARVARCQECNEVMDADLLHSVTGKEDFIQKTLSEIGLPPYDIVTARKGLEKFVHFVFQKDRARILPGLESK